MNFQKNGITLMVSDDEIRRLLIERLNEADILLSGDEVPLIDQPPRIGETWSAQGGIYAGIARGRDGAPDYYLILGPEYDGGTAWDVALDWATKINVDGFSDYGLPTRKEQALLFANVAESFKEQAYWSSEQYASDSNRAWGQSFSLGYQYAWLKGDTLRARAVRRLPIQ